MHIIRIIYIKYELRQKILTYIHASMWLKYYISDLFYFLFVATTQTHFSINLIFCKLFIYLKIIITI